MEKIHDRVFDYLQRWRDEARLNDKENPFFYMRSVKDERFKKGYWFPGNEQYLCLSFWAGGDSLNKTPNVYFEISKKHGCRIIIVAKDSEYKFRYFQQMVHYLNKLGPNNYTKTKSKMWVSKLSPDFVHWHDHLVPFIKNGKKLIDNYILDNPKSVFEEFTSKFSFIESKDFDRMYSRVLHERDLIKEAEYRQHREFITAPKMQLGLIEISIENFHDIKNAQISNLNPDAQWIFITGENGFGKTSLLQAIALGLNSDPDLEKHLDDSRIEIQIVHENEKAYPVRTKGSLSTADSYNFGRYILGYGPIRLNVQSNSSENMENRSKHHVMSLFESETLLKNINYELFSSRYTDNKMREFEELRELIQILTDRRISNIGFLNDTVVFVEKLPNGEELKPVPLSKLAAGFRSIINLATDIHVKLKQVFPGKQSQDFYGIVLIDELENHLHPIFQKKLPTLLSKVFPKIQFIASIHSPIPILGAPLKSEIIKVNRDIETGITLERIVIDNIELLNPNILLTSPIFGFSDIFNTNIKTTENLRTEDSWTEMNRSDDIDRKLVEMYHARTGR